MEVFLSHSFREEDSDLVSRIEALLASHDVRLLTGRRLAGGQITQEVMDRIRRSDGLIALMTKRETVGDPQQGRWRTHPWVVAELNYARGLPSPIPTIALLEAGVEPEGPFADHERIHYSAESLLDAFLALSETLRLWKSRRGRTRMAHLLPDEVGRELRANRNLQCRFRFVAVDGSTSAWSTAEPMPGLGGTVLYLNGVRDDTAQVQVEIADQQAIRWYSELTPQSIRIEMRQEQ